MPDETTKAEGMHSRIAELIENELWGQAASEISHLPPADAAEVLGRCSPEVAAAVINFLPDASKPDIISHLEPEDAAEVMEALPSDEAAEILDEMDPDDSADILAEFDKSAASQVIERMEDGEAEDVRRLMTYPADSAGGIMTTDLVTIGPDATVLDALDTIAATDGVEHIHQVYVTDAARHLVGIATIVDLIQQRDRATKLRDIMATDFVSVNSATDQEEVARVLSKYSLSVIPVVDADGVLLGRVTHDDAIDVIQEEAEEDIFRMAGSDHEELGRISTLRSCAIRLPWLGITLLGGVITSSLLNFYSQHFAAALILAAFIPNVMAMGGNTGLQSSVLLIREIASGPARRHSPWQMFWHEVRTGALMGLICGAGIFLWALALQRISGGGAAAGGGIAPWQISGIAAVAMFSAMSFAAGFGAVVPLAFDRLKIDPAVASGPFISVANDIAALLIYYAVTALLIMRLAA